MGLTDLFGSHEKTGDHKLKVCYYGDPVLERVSAPLGEITPELRVFADAMIEAMYLYDGVGLAAPQVGHNIRMIVLDTHQSDEPLPPDASIGERMLVPLMPVVLLNPEMISASEEKVTGEEGCLSFPKIFGDVTRSQRVVFRARLLDGSTVQGEAGGLLARCLQHELDHLNGIVFVERMSEADREAIDKPLKALRKATRRQIGKKT